MNCGVTELSELWMPVAGYEGLYEVSNFGKVRAVARIVNGRWGQNVLQGRLLKPSRASGRYFKVTLYSEGVGSQLQVHSLVLKAFLGDPPQDFQGDHIDFDITNNSLSNLRWIHRVDNVRRRRSSKLTQESVDKIRLKHQHGASTQDLSEEFGVSTSHVAHVNSFDRWKEKP